MKSVCRGRSCIAPGPHPLGEAGDRRMACEGRFRGTGNFRNETANPNLFRSGVVRSRVRSTPRRNAV